MIAVGPLSSPDVLHNGVERDNDVGGGALPKERAPGGHASDIRFVWFGAFFEEQPDVVPEGALEVAGVTCVGERVKIVDLWRPLPLLGGRNKRHSHLFLEAL